MLLVVDAYSILKMIHVLAAVIWVGGATAINVLATHLQRTGDAPRRLAFAYDAEWIGTRVFAPSSLLVLLFGIFAALKAHYSFASAWLVLGIVGVGLTGLTGSLFFGPELRRIRTLAGQRGLEDQEVTRRIDRVVAIGRFDLLVLLLVVVDMVLKPGL